MRFLNTWIPGPVGPPGPEGPQGDPGTGVNVTTIVPTLVDLPDPAQKPNEFAIVQQDNTLYYSTGLIWEDVGSPIQGPQGEPGLDGSNGINGINGSPGKGWTGTTIIDERPLSYQVRFDSVDGLGFVTDNIMGPQGNPGELEVASATNIGGIKIGRGLSILPDGTAQAGDTFVDIETVPIGPDGTPQSPTDNYAFDFETQFDSWGDNITGYQDGSSGSSRSWTLAHTSVFQMPTQADGAVIYYFSSSGTTPYASPGSLVPGWFNGESKVEVEGGTFEDGGALGVPHTHQFATISSQVGQAGSTPILKLGLVRFEQGAELTFKAYSRVTTARKVAYNIGRGRLAIVPFKSGTGQVAVSRNTESQFRSSADESDTSGH